MHPEDATYITPMCNWVPAPWHLTVLWDPREQLTILSQGYRSSQEVQWKGVLSRFKWASHLVPAFLALLLACG